MTRSVREALQMTALGIGVTVVGLVTGAFVMSPAVSREQRMLALAGLAGVGLLTLLVMGYGRLRDALRSRMRSRARAVPVSAPSKRMGSKASRTPRAVQALAAAGAAPTEIAWKTGLPVDAVSMLLELSGPRVSTS